MVIHPWTKGRAFLPFTKKILVCFYILGGVFLADASVFSQQKSLKFHFDRISIDPSTVMGGQTAHFPDPVLSVLTVKDPYNRYVHGLADTARWLSVNDISQSGLRVSDVWKNILEYHADDSNKPRNPDVKQTRPGFLVREMKLDIGLSTSMVMDYSGSMIGRFDSVKAAAKVYVRNMGKNDRLAVFKFSRQCVLMQDFTNDTTKLMAAIDKDSSDWAGTYLYDALWTALDATQKEPERRVVITYTDGRDHLLGHTIDEVIQHAKNDSIPIYTIGLSNNNPNGGGPQIDKLQRISDETGGLFFFAPSLDSLANIYKAIYGHISGYYVLAHTSPDPFTNGTKRVLDLTLDYADKMGSTTTHYVGRDTIHYKVPFIPPNVTPRLTVVTDSVSGGANPRHYAMAGDTVQFDISVKDAGRGAAAETRMVFAPGDSLSPVSYSVAPDSAKKDSVYWSFPKILASDSIRIHLKARLRSKMPRGDKTVFSRVRVTCLDDSLSSDNSAQTVLYGMGRPDFTVRVIPIEETLSPGYPVRFAAVVRNIGNSDCSAPFKVGLFRSDSASTSATQTIQSLALNDSVRVEFDVSFAQSGRVILRVTADALNQIPEVNDNNNSDETAVEVGWPDFATRVIPVADTLSPGYPVRLSAVVRNIGNANCGAPFVIALYQGNSATATAAETVPSLSRNDSVRVDFDTSFPLSGQYRMRVTADALGQIPESNENNNSDETYLTVGQPDFTVHVYPVSEIATPGYPVQIRAVVRNAGNADCGVPLEVGLFHHGSAQPVESRTIATLLRHDTVRVEYTVTFPVTGHYPMAVTADASNRIPESNEDNNTDETTVDVGVDRFRIQIGGFSLSDSVRGKRAHFPERVLAEVGIIDQNTHPVHGLADTSRWVGVSDMSESGESVGDIWTSLSEIHEENPSYPPNADVKQSLTATEIKNSPFSLAFVLDYSTGMATHGPVVQSDLGEWIRRFSSRDQAAVIGFGESVDVRSTLTSDKSSLQSALNQSYSGLNRRLYDALYMGIESVQNASGRNAVLAVTSGEDAGSSHTKNDVVRRAQEAGVPIHLIGFGLSASQDLQDVTDATGGWYRGAAVDSQFVSGLDFMDEALRNYYELAFASSDTTMDKTWREVRLRVQAFQSLGADSGSYPTPLGRANLAVRAFVRGTSFSASAGDTTWFVRTGERAQYSVSVLNIGHQNLTGIGLSDLLPHSFRPDSVPFAHQIRGDSLIWTLDSLPIRGIANYRYSTRADTLFSFENVPMADHVRADCAQDTILYDNQASDVVIYIPLKPPDFEVRVSGTGDSLAVVRGDSTWYTFAGKTVSYKVTLTNIGELSCRNISVRNVFPQKLTLQSFNGAAYEQRGDTLFWSINTLSSRGGRRLFTYTCKVDTFLPPWEIALINTATAHSDEENIPWNNTDSDTMVIAALVPPDPQVRIEPALVEPGDSVRVEVLTPVRVVAWDVFAFYETGERIPNYADDFVRLHPDPETGEWIRIEPAFEDTRMRTDNKTERVGIVFQTTDLWNVTRYDTAYLTIRSSDAFFLDRNCFQPIAGERMNFRFKLSSNRRTEIIVYDVSGAFVDQITGDRFPAGWNSVDWNGVDERGNAVGSGLYVAVFRSGELQKALKFILVR
jgi:VWFA-related protein